MDFKTVDDNRRTWILQGDRPVAAIQDTGIRSYICNRSGSLGCVE